MKEKTTAARREYWREYYRKNRGRILLRKKARYVEDLVFREKFKEHMRKYQEQKRKDPVKGPLLQQYRWRNSYRNLK